MENPEEPKEDEEEGKERKCRSCGLRYHRGPTPFCRNPS